MQDIAQNHGYWNATAPLTDFAPLTGEIDVDIAIVGGGIVGMTTARLLKDRGLRVAVVEALRVGRQVTGKSTAKVTSQHRLIYDEMASSFGSERAQLYAEAQQWGVEAIRDLVERFVIDCDLTSVDAYTYTLDVEMVPKIEAETERARAFGLPATMVRMADLPFDIRAAIRFENQAHFHPVKYIVGLARSVDGDGCHVFENSRVIDWSPTRIETSHGSVAARHIVMATHLPLGQVGLYYSRAYPYAEPAVAAKIRRVPSGMFISAEQPTHSIRTHRSGDGSVYAIVIGSSFKPGHVDEERERFEEIERWLSENFDAETIEYRWVNEDYRPMDGAPFVGWSSSITGERYLVATGFNAWGISNGTAAGKMLASLATGTESPWLQLFDATRIRPLAGASEFVKENVHVATHLAKGYLATRPKSSDELKRGQAAILEIKGDRCAAYRDEDGSLHTVSAMCTHMGCIVGWNETDRSWDCPCHGSRFTLEGHVLHGPATRPLGSGIKT
jgi:glycine/D-amino acid oxidase-like deaminating enzyme/nitrite reductase/ring-hydroxylating ferredoxin subunit